MSGWVMIAIKQIERALPASEQDALSRRRLATLIELSRVFADDEG